MAAGKPNTLYLLITTMRPKQWTKNLIIFAGVIFAQKIFQDAYLLKTFYGFILFCLLSGSVYIINDIIDIDKDRAHPVKRNRPLASGQLGVLPAAVFVTFTGLGSLAGAFLVNRYFGAVALAYFLLTFLYSLKLKNIVIIDVLTIAFGFIFRAMAGVVIISVDISPWLLVCTFLLALFLALTKRRHELVLLDENARAHRKILEEYEPEMLDQMISVVTSSTVMAYSLYTFTAGHSIYLMATIPFVVYGIFRYQYLVHRKDVGGSPETALLKDTPMLVNVLLWVITSALILYLT
ncbi:MAG: decaprenyl-phosphate phosphoribosyltransferase [Firmicutes bacterium HGW-Firmicutes-14]|nr:MAG: decaprenyl-phosphate phosphoribosyltransferase [Firmicutes bacterium HGW-Firmicutes-14]